MLRIAILLALFAAAASAQGWADRYIKEAEEKARADDFLGAAAIYAKSFERAQDNDDLETEARLGRSLRASFARLWKREAPPDGAGRGGLRETLFTLMKPLDAERGGAWLSAHLLAGQLLMRATWAGDFRYVAEAAKVLEARAGAKNPGLGAGTMLSYARGMLALEAKRDAEAGDSLSLAVETMVREGWSDLACFAGTELAALHVRTGKEGAASEVMARIASLCPAEGDPQLTEIWERVVKARLGGAPAAVRRPCEAALEAQRKAGSTGVPPGEEGEGATGGATATSLLGRRLPGLSKRKPIMQAVRSPAGFGLKTEFDDRFKFTQPYLPGVRHRGNQGISLSFFGAAVALAKFDLTGKEDDPRSYPLPSPFEAFYHLANGEEWRITKGGAVTVER